MKTRSLLVAAILFSLLTASAAFAADDGNTKPRLTTVATYYGTTDIINQTSVAGNVKGVSCSFVPGAGANLIFTVDGGTAQTIGVPGDYATNSGNNASGWIPMNIRFTSSIRVQLAHTGSSYESACSVSWAPSPRAAGGSSPGDGARSVDFGRSARACALLRADRRCTPTGVAGARREPPREEPPAALGPPPGGPDR
jgi:hypothetical protein